MGFFICLGTFLGTAAGLAAAAIVTFFTAHFITSNGILIQILTDFSKLKIIAYLSVFFKNISFPPWLPFIMSQRV